MLLFFFFFSSLAAFAPWLPQLRSLGTLTTSSTIYADAETGDDAEDGTTPATAVRTLARAAALVDPSGGTRLVLRGVFSDSLRLQFINVAANPSRPTLIECAVDAGTGRCASPGAVIDGAPGRTHLDYPVDLAGGELANQAPYMKNALLISRGNYVYVRGVAVHNSLDTAVYIWESTNVVLSQLEVSANAKTAVVINCKDKQWFQPYINRDITLQHSWINQNSLGYYPNYVAAPQNMQFKTECVSFVHVDGFEIAHNTLSNTLMEGIDFKYDSQHGRCHNNWVENTRSGSIYCNECLHTHIYENVVYRAGYYDRENGSGPFPAGLRFQGENLGVNCGVPFACAENGATGITAGNGDLLGADESGRTINVTVRRNVVAFARAGSASLKNEWAVLEPPRPNWEIRDVVYEENTFVHAMLGEKKGAGALTIYASMTSNITMRNNIVAELGFAPAVGIYRAALNPSWPSIITIDHQFYFNTSSAELSSVGAAGSNYYFLPGAGNVFVRAPASLTESSTLWDFSLTSTSAARGAGSGGIDVGAYQFGAAKFAAGIDACVERGVSCEAPSPPPSSPPSVPPSSPPSLPPSAPPSPPPSPSPSTPPSAPSPPPSLPPSPSPTTEDDVTKGDSSAKGTSSSAPLFGVDSLRLEYVLVLAVVLVLCGVGLCACICVLRGRGSARGSSSRRSRNRSALGSTVSSRNRSRARTRQSSRTTSRSTSRPISSIYTPSRQQTTLGGNPLAY